MSKEKIKVYLYTRVSTTMQIDGYSLDAQKTKMKAFCDYNEYEIAGEYKVVLKERDAWSDFSKFYWRNGSKVCGSNGLGQFAGSGFLSS